MNCTMPPQIQTTHQLKLLIMSTGEEAETRVSMNEREITEIISYVVSYPITWGDQVQLHRG